MPTPQPTDVCPTCGGALASAGPNDTGPFCSCARAPRAARTVYARAWAGDAVNARITVRVAKQDGTSLVPPRPWTWGVEVVCTLPTPDGPEERSECYSDHDKREQARAAARELRADSATVRRIAARILGNGGQP